VPVYPRCGPCSGSSSAAAASGQPRNLKAQHGSRCKIARAQCTLGVNRVAARKKSPQTVGGVFTTSGKDLAVGMARREIRCPGGSQLMELRWVELGLRTLVRRLLVITSVTMCDWVSAGRSGIMKEIRTVAGIGSVVLLRMQCPMSRTCGPLIKALKSRSRCDVLRRNTQYRISVYMSPWDACLY